METFSGVLVSSGIDYLTCTYRSWELSKPLQILLDEMVRKEHSSGSKIKPWGFAGYKGWHCGGVQCGERDDGWCVRLSGEMARLNWWDFYTESDNITRLDCQCTVKFDCDPTAQVVCHEREAKRFKKKHKCRWEARWIGSTNGSRTLYIGSRNSLQFMRIYNKQAESKSKAYQGCVRYETQFNGVLSSLHAQSMSGKLTVQEACAAKCSEFMVNHGVSRQFSANDMSHVCAPAIEKNYDKSLRWLATQVRPTVQYLISLGLEQEVLESLGLSDELIKSDSRPESETETVH